MEYQIANGALSLKGYDFVDFGCSSGGSIQFAKDKFGGGRELGLDIDPEKVAKTRAKGFEAEVADVSQLDPDALGTVRFAIMAHFLEHLPSLDLAAKCIRSAIAVSQQFVFIRQPYFDADQYLADLGLQAYWSNWHGHTNHMTTHDFRNILWELEARGIIQRYILFGRTRIEDSNDSAVHLIGSEINQHNWEPGRHERKPYHKFFWPLYREVGAVIHTRRPKVDEGVSRFLLSCDILFDSAD